MKNYNNYKIIAYGLLEYASQAFNIILDLEIKILYSNQ